MKSLLINKTRRWLGVSVLALSVAAGSGAVVGLNTYPALAQVTVPPNTASAPASFANLVEAVRPAVVSITVEGTEQAPQMSSGQDFFFNFPDLPKDHPLRKFFREFGPNGQGQGQGQGQPPARHFQAAGSGFLISADGYVVTNNHVVKDASKVTVVDDKGNEYAAEVVGTDPRTDLALLKMHNVKDMSFVKLADAEARVGDWVIAVGNPFGLGGTVTAGIVSARGRDISGSATGDFLQIDAAVNRGNSGGPDFNLKGEVVGVNTAIFSPNGGNVGIAFAIPASIVKQVVAQLKTSGKVTRGFLGVSIQDVTKDIADSVGLSQPHGAVVTEPSANSPAENAGIKSGDIITAVNGQAITNALDLSRTIGGIAPGTKVDVTIWRNGKEQKLSVTLGTLNETKATTKPAPEQAPQQAEPAGATVAGISVVPNSDGPGVLIQDIDPNSVAATKGLAMGDVILEVNNQAIKAPADLEKAVQSAKDGGRSTVLLKVSRNGAVRFIGLPLNQQG